MRAAVKKGISIFECINILVLSIFTFALTMFIATSAIAQEEEQQGEEVNLEQTVFSKKYVRGEGEPITIQDAFSVGNPQNDFSLLIQNGENGQNKVSSATVSINGNEVVAQNEVNQQVDYIRKPIVLQSNNTIAVQLESSPGGFVVINIIEVTQTSVIAMATPTSGYAPLSVSFSAIVAGTATLYEWDFATDGIYDYSSAASADTIYTYNAAGSYTATVRITDTSGAISTDTVDISVRNPIQTVAVESSNLEQIVFTKTYMRETSGPSTVEDQFSVGNPENQFFLHIQNGADGENRVSSAIISINGQVVVTPNEFNQQVEHIEVPVDLDLNNVISVQLRSAPGGFISVEISEIILAYVVALANPTSGYAPLGVSFSATVVGSPTLFEWDFETDGTYDYSSSTSPDVAHTYSAIGEYTATIKVTDASGAVLVDSIGITAMKPLQAIPRAAPTSGIRPLQVTFVPGGTDETGTIIQYRWDYDGNGTWDWSHALPNVSYHTYSTAGTYDATLRVLDNHGMTDTASINIVVTNPPPTVSASANPTNGPVPLDVNFSGTASSPNGPIVLYEWDFDGDGTYDWSSATTASVTHTYTEVGTYGATLRVTDSIGMTSSAGATVVIHPRPEGSPSITMSASPTSGMAPLTVSFTATATSPNGAITLYEWDFESDGTVDWSSTTTGNTSHTYTNSGVFDALLKVTDVAGGIGLDSIRIDVGISITIARSTDSFNPTNGETVTVTSTYTGGAAIDVMVRDRLGNMVKNLTNGEQRSAGTYTDVWDGTDEAGTVVSDGAYYFLVKATMPGGGEYTYDPTGTGLTGTQRRAGGYSASFPSSFSPYEDNFCTITYNVQVAGEVTADICPYSYYGERVKQLLGRVMQTRGSHTIIWDGTKDDGSMIEGGLWLVTIWTYDITGNGVVAGGAKPEITNVAADPNYYDPTYHADEPVGFRSIVASYNLSKLADVTLRVFDMQNNLVRTIVQSSVPAGANTIAWDGRNDTGEFVLDKSYKLGLKATDSMGNQSMTMYAFLKLYY